MAERKLRKELAKQGYRLYKGRDAYGCVGYFIADSSNCIVGGNGNYDMSLNDVETFVKE